MLLIFLKIGRELGVRAAGEKVKGALWPTSPAEEPTEEEKTSRKRHSAPSQLERKEETARKISGTHCRNEDKRANK